MIRKRLTEKRGAHNVRSGKERVRRGSPQRFSPTDHLQIIARGLALHLITGAVRLADNKRDRGGEPVRKGPKGLKMKGV